MADDKITITIVGNVEDGEIKALEQHVEELNGKGVATTIDVDKGELDAADEEIENMNGKTISVNVAMENIGGGLNQAKQGISGLADGLGEVQQAGLQSEQSFEFLKMNLGGDADAATKKLKQINDTVASMPGDDATMRQVLTTATALGEDLDDTAMKDATGTMADYMQGAQMMGKNAREAQQDIMKYMLDGNTAELENNSIVSSKVDKLKEATTFQERQAAMQEVLNELGYGGVASLDTTMNKQAEWEGMMFNAQDSLSRMWLTGEKGAMDYILKLDEGSGHLVSMGLVAGQMAAGPVTDLMSGLGQIGLGFKTLKDAADFTGITGKLSALKTALMNVGTKAKEAALYMLDLGKKTLIAGYNAAKAAVMWVAQKVQLIASTVATYAMAAAQAVLNFVMSLNPIVLVVIAIVALIAVLIYLYYNVDSVRQAIDNLGASIIATAQWIWNGFMNIVNTVSSALSSAWNTITNFCSNFVSGLINAASSAVSGFVSYIQQIPQMVLDEFNRTLGLVGDFISSLPSRVWDMGVAIIDALKGALGIGSPGYMYYMVEGEFDRINRLTEKTSFDTGSIGDDMVNNFNPGFNVANQGMNTGINLTVNIENVDNEERIQQIVKAVEAALKFDNETAGRSV